MMGPAVALVAVFEGKQARHLAWSAAGAPPEQRPLERGPEIRDHEGPSLLDTAGVHKLGGERCKSRADAPRLRLDETPAEVPPLLRVNLGRLSLPRDLGEA